jgi:hypothetical protein
MTSPFFAVHVHVRLEQYPPLVHLRKMRAQPTEHRPHIFSLACFTLRLRVKEEPPDFCLLMPLLVEKHASKTMDSEKQSDKAGEDCKCPIFITSYALACDC